MLDAVSTGLHPSAVVTQLAEKYGVTERALWNDWQRRDKWVPVAAGFDYFTTMNGIQIFQKPKMFEKYRYYAQRLGKSI